VSPAAALGLYSIVLAVVVPQLLTRFSLAERAPRLTLLLWQAATLSLIVSVTLAGIALAVPTTMFSSGLSNALSTCVTAITAQYSTPGGALAGTAGLILACAVVCRVLGSFGWSTVASTRARRTHARALNIVGYEGAACGVTIVDHDLPAAYCLPGRNSHIVLTTSALALLDPEQVGAVLAHERAHLRGRHHLPLGFAQAMTKAFPGIPLLRRSAEQTASIIELLADDAAGRTYKRETLVTALLALAAPQLPTTALGATGPTSLARARRLLRPARPLGIVSVVLLSLVGFLLVSMPIVVAASPAMAVRNVNLCPIPVMSDIAAPAPRDGSLI